jgi:hypothetical protein
MQVETARKLLALVNGKQNMERLEAYVGDRLNYLHHQLEQCPSETEMYSLQGQIREIRRLLTLKDEAVQKAEEGKQ